MKRGKAVAAPAVEMPRIFGKREEGINLTVIHGEAGCCERCGLKGMTFTCHLFREPLAGKIEELCQGCTVTRAGGVSFVAVRDSEYLRRKWRSNAPLECHLTTRRTRHSASGAKVDLGDGGGA